MKNKPVFTSSIFDFKQVNDNNDKTFELYNRIANTGDDRSKIILAGIIVEHYFDRVLKLLFIDYKNLTERSDFTFSFKIALLKSLRLIPNNIIVMCDCVRKVRNIFAHNFEIDSIKQIEKKVQNQIHQLYTESAPNKDDELINKFEVVYRLGSSYLRTYEINVKLLREKIDSPIFEKELQHINKQRMHEFHEELMRNGPIEIIDRGNGEIEERYSKSFGVIRKRS